MGVGKSKPAAGSIATGEVAEENNFNQNGIAVGDVAIALHGVPSGSLTWETLPMEIKTIILSDLSKNGSRKDLIERNLVCRQFNAIQAEILPDDITICNMIIRCILYRDIIKREIRFRTLFGFQMQFDQLASKLDKFIYSGSENDRASLVKEFIDYQKKLRAESGLAKGEDVFKLASSEFSLIKSFEQYKVEAQGKIKYPT